MVTLDLLELLKMEFLSTTRIRIGSETAELDLFIEFSQKYLRKNPPVSVVYLDEGFGLKLQNGKTITLYPSETRQGMYDAGVHITQSKQHYDPTPDISYTPEIKIS